MHRPAAFAAIVLGVLLPHPSLRAADGVVEVKLAAAIQRTWDQVKADGYAYGPKQTYDAKTHETHVYLPYGKDKRWYRDVRGTLYDATATGPAKFHSSDGKTNAVLTYRLHFDRPIGSFRYFVGWSEVGLAASTAAGVEYSVDGKAFKTMAEVRGERSAAVEPLVKDFKATGLRTETLYVRYYTRDPGKPGASGPGRWLQFRMSGDPRWGDAARTFFACQHQIWVTAAKGKAPAPAAEPAAEPAVEPTSKAVITEMPGEPVQAVGGAFGIASGAEWSGDHARLLPLLREANVASVRLFPEWPTFQSAPGRWDFSGGDALVASGRKNHIEIFGVFAYLAPFASSAPPGADHGARTRTFPVKDMQHWRDYVAGVVKRYHRDVAYWEVYNEFNSGGFARNATVKDYVKLVRDAYTTARKIDPNCKIGIGCADVDLSFLERAIVQGAAGHFDFVNVHPYSLMGAVMAGREPVFLRMGANLRKMLAKTAQRKDIALWVSEVGRPTTNQPGPERTQAEAVAKAYVLCFAQGIERVYWFEGRGPSYGSGGDFGLIRKDWTKRPSFVAMKTMTGLLGPRPQYLGWLNPTGKSYGFVFKGTARCVLVAWAAGDEGDALGFPAAVTVTDLAGRAEKVAPARKVALTRAPVFVTDLPETVVATARAQGPKPFPWLKDFARATSVSCAMGQANVTGGLTQLTWGDGKTVVGLVDGTYARRTDRANKMLYMYFDVDDSYVSVGDKAMEITIVARRVDPAKNAGCNIVYESATGYRNLGEWWTIPAEQGWHRHTFKITNANFANNWGWNFRIEVPASPDDLWVKEVIVKRIGAKN